MIIWIAKEIRPEHQTALDWLNDATQGKIDFFGIELELVQIQGFSGSSLKAPNFKIVVAPKSAGALPPPQDGERGQRYQAFFQDALARIKAMRPGVTRASRVGYGSWLATPSGKTGFSFVLAFASSARFRLELYIDVGDREYDKAAFDSMRAGKEAIEEGLGAQLSWERLDNRRASRVAWYWDEAVTVMDGPDSLEQLKAWAVENYFRFRDVLSPYLENLPSVFEPTAVAETSEPASVATPTEEGA